MIRKNVQSLKKFFLNGEGMTQNPKVMKNFIFHHVTFRNFYMGKKTP